MSARIGFVNYCVVPTDVILQAIPHLILSIVAGNQRDTGILQGALQE